MAVHTNEQRTFIVRRIAQYYTPREIEQHFRGRWPDTACASADVFGSDPRAVLLPPDLHAEFTKEREAYDAALAAEWPDLPPAIRVAARCLQRDIEWARDRGALEQAMKSTAELTKLLSGFYAGKNVAPPATPDTEPVGRIEHHIVDPKAPDANTANPGGAKVCPAVAAGAL